MTAATAHHCNWCNQPMRQLDKGLVCDTDDAVTIQAACGCARIFGPGPRREDVPCGTHGGGQR